MEREIEAIAAAVGRIEGLIAAMPVASGSNPQPYKLAYTAEELAEAMSVADKRKIDEWRRNGLLRGIKTGKGWIYSRNEVAEFMTRYSGMDLSSPQAQQIALVQTSKGRLKQ